MSRQLNNCVNIEDLYRLAKRRLPAPMFEYLRGGAEDELALQNNRNAYSGLQLIPNYLRDVSSVDTSSRVLGCDVAMPIVLAPVGFTGLFHHHKEVAAAAAAEKYQVPYSLATWGSSTPEEISAASSAAKMMQLYIPSDRERAYVLAERAKAAGFSALCVTVDTPVHGNREKAWRMGMPPPAKMPISSILSILSHPRWLYNFIKNKPTAGVSLFDQAPSPQEMLAAGPTADLVFEDISRLRERWDGPLAIKGVLSVEDASLAVEHGASAIILSNHGGRQFDAAPAPLDLLPAIVDAVGDRAEIIVDGGIRRGVDVLKAIALGATACMIGRPYIYGLAAGGQLGVERALQIFKEELQRNMMLMGVTRIDDVDSRFVHAQVGTANQSALY
ncbi:alpha-hydroxy-acid oxidizing protein [Parahaliea sp. F7430]|uniref:Alpha-hydroxy-acid oxidizing protein n=1 Tax=Sediminihaliea albiluteola TaxID=2758564 RepID=A0A7W2TWL5_9GAMM|nr:alpha-hydroxy acid oxidase [Sediminihaliea albiluteola]MBA6413159.1 alpha-hydroxy-acid oxidizing protein [Sediminihaliea albiluteola]